MPAEFLQTFGETISVVIGFAIFFWILKKFAWRPVLEVIDERQKQIQDGYDEVKQLQAEAAEAHKRYEERLKHIEAEGRERIAEAVAEGQRVAAEITEKAREEAGLITERARKKLDLEVESAREKLRREIIDLTIHATERLIRERVDETRDRELVGSFIDELEKMN